MDHFRELQHKSARIYDTMQSSTRHRGYLKLQARFYDLEAGHSFYLMLKI